MPINHQSIWNKGDQANFTLPGNIQITGIVSHVQTFADGNIFISFPMIKLIKQTSLHTLFI